jgi:hypothetical protein
MRVNTSRSIPCELSVNKNGKCFLVSQDDARNWVELRGVGRRVDLGCVRPCSSWTLRRLRSSLHSWIQIESRLQPYTTRNLSHLHALHMRMGVSLLMDVPLALLHGICSHERYWLCGGVYPELLISDHESRRSPCDMNDNKSGLPVFS